MNDCRWLFASASTAESLKSLALVSPLFFLRTAFSVENAEVLFLVFFFEAMAWSGNVRILKIKLKKTRSS